MRLLGTMARWLGNDRGAAAPGAPTVTELMETSPELAALFARLGHSPREAARVRALLAEMKTLIRAEVSDFAALRKAVVAAASQGEAAALGSVPANRQLLQEVHAAGGDEGAVLALLNRDPVYEQLPFIEQIPLQQGGEIAWRTPVDHSLIRKHPADPRRFLAALEELEGHFRLAHPARGEGPRMEVLAAVARLHRELGREKAYLPTAVQFLEKKVADFEQHSLQPEALAMRDTLVRLLDRVARARASCAQGLDAKARCEVRRDVAEQAGVYLRCPRLHARWLSGYLLGTLLDENLAESGGARQAPARLAWIREEVESGHFDAAETIRRLRELEGEGIYVHSVAYALLRLGGARPLERGAGRKDN